MNQKHWMTGVICLALLVAGGLHDKALAQTDNAATPAAADSRMLFTSSLMDLRIDGALPADPSYTGSPSAARFESNWLIKAAPHVRMMRVRNIKLQELVTDPPVESALDPMQDEFYTNYWGAYGNEGSKPLAEAKIPMKYLAVAAPYREIVSIKATADVLYSAEQPREIRLTPVDAYLDKWIEVEDVPGMRFHITRQPTRTCAVNYEMSLTWRHQHHLAQVRFLNSQGNTVDVHNHGRGQNHFVKRIDLTPYAPTERSVFHTCNLQGEVHAIVLDIFPTLETARVMLEAANLPVFRPVKDQDVPSVEIDITR